MSQKEKNSKLGGFFLDFVQLLNWGTFDQDITTLNLDGKASLLTGDNGSGKSTLVDALLTLLVPNRQRNYNLSSGSQQRERSEKSYVQGAYGREENEFGQGKTKTLRNKSSYSVILASFVNHHTEQTCTLAQFFWQDQSDIRKIFVIAPKRLTIEKDFNHIKSVKNLKTHLKQQHSVQVFQTFSDYEKCFFKIFGLKTEKATALFNQVTAIKEIGKLNHFVRSHMLDYQDPTDPLQQLFENYQNLQLSYDAIILAKKQLTELEPLCEAGESLCEIEKNIQVAKKHCQVLPFYFSILKQRFCEKELTHLEVTRTTIESDLKNIMDQIVSATTEYENLKEMLLGSGSAAAKKEIRWQIKKTQSLLKEKIHNFQNYEKIAHRLKWPVPKNSQNFSERRVIAKEFLKEWLTQSDNFEKKIFTKKSSLKETENILLKHQTLHKQFTQQRSNLRPDLVKCRDEIASVLGLKKSQLPFVAELIELDPNHKEWHRVINSLLYHFGQRLLVPSNYAHDIHKHLQKAHFPFRLFYEIIDSTKVLPPKEESKDSLYEKLLFHHEKSMTITWLKSKIKNDFNFQCATDLRSFKSAPKALMVSGLIKRSHSLHEKDGRGQTPKAAPMIFGWDNSDAVEEQRTQIIHYTQVKEKTLKDLVRIEKERSDHQELKSLVEDLLKFSSFHNIDVSGPKKELDSLEQQLKLADKNNDTDKKREQRLEQVKEQVDTLQKKRDTLTKKMGEVQAQLKHNHEERSLLSEVLADHNPTHIIKSIESDIKKAEKKNKIKIKSSSLRELDVLSTHFATIFNKKLQQSQQKRSGYITALIRRMATFKAEFPELCLQLDAKVDHFDEFVVLRNRLSLDSLPTHEKRFKKLLNKSVINDMLSFKATLDLWYEHIEDHIEELNVALSQVAYSDQSYLQLKVRRSRDTDIREFQGILKDAIATTQKNDSGIEESFVKIKDILSRLSQHENWRKKVTDVRQWADFFAVECHHQTTHQLAFYSDSSGLSGGQKAKLAFTILASSIAYQYGLHQKRANEKSFRFVVIDEAFSKSDERNSTYAMTLFAKLGLQLMVVTPRDKIQVAQPFVSHVFHTTINKNRNKSKIHSLHIHNTKQDFQINNIEKNRHVDQNIMLS